MNTFEFVRCSKNDVRVRSMFDKMVFDPSLQNVFLMLNDEKFSKSSEGLLGSMFDVRSFEAKNMVFEFDHQ